MKKLLIIASLVLLILAGAHRAWSSAPNPTEFLRAPLNEVMRILTDQKYQGKDQATKDRQHEALWKIINQVFDFTEVSKRTLARNWTRFSVAERQQFRDLFSELLGNIYIEQIQRSFEGEKVVFSGQEMLAADRAEVKTRVLLQNGTLPIDYSVIKKGDKWLVYDVKVEGVSLVKNYRTQFNQMLLQDPPSKVLASLKDKLARQRRGEKLPE
ncbi:MAG: ABC transporter substrate-binding protein [Deltaproteobacteria bacterium]|nr:ABC transporter substrate-binding protein [Deltaproteobacteria bacterium]